MSKSLGTKPATNCLGNTSYWAAKRLVPKRGLCCLGTLLHPHWNNIENHLPDIAGKLENWRVGVAIVWVAHFNLDWYSVVDVETVLL